MQFEIKTQKEVYTYQLEMPSLSLRIKKDGEFSQNKITFEQYMDWKLLNMVKPLSVNTPTLRLSTFDDPEFSPYYDSVLDILIQFQESYKKAVSVVPKS